MKEVGLGNFEAILTPAVEIAWSKRRILEVYINIAEFDQGIFGIRSEPAAVWITRKPIKFI